MDKIDEKTAYITMVINSQNFIAQIDATDCDPFLSTPRQISYVVPVGDINSGVINSYGRIGNITYIEGSFTNIGP
jgi:hypothetical protein